MNTGIKVVGSFPDNSGYGDSNRADVAALYTAGVDITIESVAQTLQTAPHGWVGNLCNHLEGREINYKIKLIHLTPDLYPRYLEDGEYHIGRLVHETNKLPDVWVAPCNRLNEIWTMTEGQKEIIKNSGVTVPIHVFPESLDITNLDKEMEPFQIPSFTGTVFYSIFQWIERKDPWSLLTTYWKTFEGKEDVVLILKTYKNSYTESDFNKIKEEIERWKKGLKLRHYPRVALLSKDNEKNLWPMDKIWKLHKMGGTFISTSHQEGWCRPAVEAMLYGNAVIAINKTGFADIVPKDFWYPVNCADAEVSVQSQIPWYTSSMRWYNIDTKGLSEAMLSCYTNNKESKEKGMKASQFVKDNFNYHTVGFQMANRLREIERFL